jgi:hypothetical protein
MGTLLIGALLVGGVIWFLVRMFRRKTPAAPAPGSSPDFYSNRPNGPAGGNTGGGNYNRGPVPPQGQGQAPDFYSNRPGMGGGGGMGGSGIGGMLATGAAAAAGAYIGNRMASGGHNDVGNGMTEAGLGRNTPHNLDPNVASTGGAAAGGGFPALGGTDAANDTPPDYFSPDDAGTDDSTDYFSSDDNSSYDDLSSDDTGGGGFDDNSDNSGSW